MMLGNVSDPSYRGISTYQTRALVPLAESGTVVTTIYYTDFDKLLSNRFIFYFGLKEVMCWNIYLFI